ncbi:MAG: hemerythrin family protein [Holophaga sp.]|jgi:hemerythrin-like metal-binding protein
MDAPRWDSPEPVGIPRLDEQHLQMHRLVTGLIRALEEDPGGAGAEDRFVELFHTTVEHFKTEEDYLEAHGYPDLVAHRFEHELLLDWFRDNLARRGGPSAPPLLQLAREYAEIIQRHQQTVDQAYVAWLK